MRRPTPTFRRISKFSIPKTLSISRRVNVKFTKRFIDRISFERMQTNLVIKFNQKCFQHIIRLSLQAESVYFRALVYRQKNGNFK